MATSFVEEKSEEDDKQDDSVAPDANTSTSDDHIDEEATRTASDGDIFINNLSEIVPHDKIVAIRQEQAKMLQVLEITNWKLSSLNDVSEETFQKSVADFRQKTKMLGDLKKQLDSIFRRIRHLKAQAAANYPEAYAAAKAKYDNEIDELS
ncbi:PREDICTED: kxDL motif-containing protein 1-like [Amphimedon queenslandica]|uniref:KxDL domain-containing protein n=1 Tax=Amphimedon queenslandica TaxID=400682 RepID=A0A1X7UE37_AMPQE|nr:PREDICTED: kxDL motif-containing protein 1-like [Amphimedon queenslandica]|eukprot:XP_011405386.1 PREDICTED: kxDL motif-containing protein 1-like [Amphimedon queenslandica]